MSQELLYTSAPRGLLPGSQGFCTVAATRGMSTTTREALEGLSAYRPMFAPDDPRNPIAYSHLKLNIGGAVRSVLSRIAPAGLDYSGRTNKLAHHVVIEASERGVAGPGSLLMQSGFFQTRWDGQVGWQNGKHLSANSAANPAACRIWEQTTGDAGWAGVLAESVVGDQRRPAVLIFSPQADPLPLIAEALLLLPPGRRWDATFMTYFTSLPPSAECLWRCVAAGTPEAKAAARMPGALVIDLTAPLGTAVGGPLVEMARTGRATQLAGRAAAVAPATPWEPSRPADFVPPPPAHIGNAWPTNGMPPPPPTTPSELDFISSRFADDPPRSRKKLVVVLALLALLFVGGIGVASFFALRTREAETPSVGAVTQEGRKEPKPQNSVPPWLNSLMRDAPLRLRQLATFLDRIMGVIRFSPKPWPMSWANAGRVIRPGTHNADGPAKSSNQKQSSDSPKQNRPPAEPPIVQIDLLRFAIPSSAPHTDPVIVDIRRDLGIEPNPSLCMRFLLVSPKPPLVVEPVTPSREIHVFAKSSTLREQGPSEFPLADIKLVNGSIHLVVLEQDRIKTVLAWRELMDSVLEISDLENRSLRRYVAMRSVAHGEVSELKVANKAGDPPFVTLNWGQYSDRPPQGTLLIDEIEIEKTDAKVGIPQGEGKPDKPDYKAMRFRLSTKNPPPKPGQLLHVPKDDLRVNESISVGFANGRLSVSVDGGNKATADNLRIRYVQIVQQVGAIKVPVLVMDKRNKGKESGDERNKK